MSAMVICLGEEKTGGKCPAVTFALSSWASAVLAVSMSVRVAISSPVEYTTAICSCSACVCRIVTSRPPDVARIADVTTSPTQPRQCVASGHLVRER